jgi:hypothetical protein
MPGMKQPGLSNGLLTLLSTRWGRRLPPHHADSLMFGYRQALFIEKISTGRPVIPPFRIIINNL